MNILKMTLLTLALVEFSAFAMDAPQIDIQNQEQALIVALQRLAKIKQSQLVEKREITRAYLNTLDKQIEEGNKSMSLAPKESPSLEDLASIAQETINENLEKEIQHGKKRKRKDKKKHTKSKDRRPRKKAKANNCLELNLIKLAGNGHSIILESLIHGANLNFQQIDGCTALIYAAKYGHLEIVELLLKHGADPTIKNEEDKTALNYAREKGFEKIVSILQKATKNWKEKN